MSTDVRVARKNVLLRTAETNDDGEGSRGRMSLEKQRGRLPDLSKLANDPGTLRQDERLKTTERTSKSRIASVKTVAAPETSPATMSESKDNKEGPKGRITAYPRAELEKELLYLPDPLKLAENTLNLLRQDEHNKALEIVRYASRTMPCTVSWNHIIDYDMSKGRVTPAMKTYNEVHSLSRVIVDIEEADTSLR